MSSAAVRRAFTLIELLVVIAIIAILIGLLVPATQSVREAGNRAVCGNNLHQLGLALSHYHMSHRRFPPANTNGPDHSWAAFLLPYLDQKPLYDQYRRDKDWDHPLNAGAIATRLPVFECPSVPHSRRHDNFGRVSAAITDYGPMTAVSAQLVRVGLVPKTPNLAGVLQANKSAELREIHDGASNTIMLAEDAGRPEYWIRGGRGPTNNPPSGGNRGVSGGRVSGSGWAAADNPLPLHGFTFDGLRSPGPCPVNCTNNHEAFAFHKVGANLLFADGSVRFVQEGVTIRVFAGLVTRSGREAVSLD